MMPDVSNSSDECPDQRAAWIPRNPFKEELEAVKRSD
jgi:hypothetical protein